MIKREGVRLRETAWVRRTARASNSADSDARGRGGEGELALRRCLYA